MFYKFYFWVSFVLILVNFLMGTDNTDKDVLRKSDLKLHTDYGTGNQYLTTWTGGITPRLDENGEIINIYRKE